MSRVWWIGGGMLMDIKGGCRLSLPFVPLLVLSVCLFTCDLTLSEKKSTLLHYTTLRYYLLPRNEERTWEAARALLVVVGRVLVGGVRVGRAGYVLYACCVVVVDGADGGVVRCSIRWA